MEQGTDRLRRAQPPQRLGDCGADFGFPVCDCLDEDVEDATVFLPLEQEHERGAQVEAHVGGVARVAEGLDQRPRVDWPGPTEALARLLGFGPPLVE